MGREDNRGDIIGKKEKKNEEMWEGKGALPGGLMEAPDHPGVGIPAQLMIDCVGVNTQTILLSKEDGKPCLRP